MFRSVRGPDSCYISNQPLYFHQMTLSEVIRAQKGIPTSQSGSSITKKDPNWPKKSHVNHPQNSMIRSVRGSDSCCIGNQPLCFHEMALNMALNKVIRAPDGILASQNGSPTTKEACIGQKRPKIISETSCSALSRDPTDVTLVT